MDNISFTGITNLYVGKKIGKSFGSYIDNYGVIKQGEKKNTEVLIKCRLTDDELGKHLTEFKEALKRCDSHYQRIYDESGNIRLHIKHTDVDDITASSISSFNLNNCDILLTNRKTLSLFTFMAKLTRDIQKLPTCGECLKYYAHFVNEKVHNTACDFIENIM